ncbi:MAG: D-cysteine desulfhydrase family protein [Planctomycetota bacterium]
MQLTEAIDRLPRQRLANLPTPLHELPRLSAELGGPRLLIKRDDLTGLATGGNKTRKLEFLLADAIEQGADTLITAGGPQSNHCRQTAAAAAKAGLDCRLVLGGDPAPRREGNLLLDDLLGAHIHWTPKPERNATMDRVADELRGEGRQPYVIPIGGSNAVGSVGYILAMIELHEQLAAAGETVDTIVFPTSSGGTQAGLAMGAKLTGFTGRVLAISVDVEPGDRAFLEEVSSVANGAADLLGRSERVAPDELAINCDYLGGGYGVVGDHEREAIRLLASTEGVLTGPVYSGRGVGALVDLIHKGQFSQGQTVLYWHTGDESALHAYVDHLTDP